MIKLQDRPDKRKQGETGMRLRLIKASEEYKEQICDMMDEWYATGEKIIPYAIRRLDYHDFRYYSENLETKMTTKDLVPDSTFFCLDEDRDKVVGAVNIRHFLNEGLLLDGGHIGDGVRPSERRKGIATKMIALALEECKKLGIYKVLMVCDKDNIGSAKSIMNNGGVLENEVEVHGDIEQRYWINLIPGKEAENKKECAVNVPCAEDIFPDIIRHMSIEEIPECVNVIRSSFKTVADEFGFTEENAPRFTAFATDERRLYYYFSIEKRPMYVYLHNGKIVGQYSLCFPDEGNNENDSTGIKKAELNNLAVLPEYRHRKIGEKLLKDAFEKVKLYGRNKLELGIVEENQRLRKWYESFGFVHTGTKKFDFFPFTCGYMEKSIRETVL